MSRIKLLQAAEIKIFNSPPVFNQQQQQYFFSVDEALEKELGRLRHPLAKVGFSLAVGLFQSRWPVL